MADVELIDSKNVFIKANDWKAIAEQVHKEDTNNASFFIFSFLLLFLFFFET